MLGTHISLLSDLGKKQLSSRCVLHLFVSLLVAAPFTIVHYSFLCLLWSDRSWSRTGRTSLRIWDLKILSWLSLMGCLCSLPPSMQAVEQPSPDAALLPNHLTSRADGTILSCILALPFCFATSQQKARVNYPAEEDVDLRRVNSAVVRNRGTAVKRHQEGPFKSMQWWVSRKGPRKKGRHSGAHVHIQNYGEAKPCNQEHQTMVVGYLVVLLLRGRHGVLHLDHCSPTLGPQMLLD